MTKSFDRLKKVRQTVINIVNDLSMEEINKIPDGFNNNIAWNLGHLIAAQQGICYVRPGLKQVVDEKYFLQYKPGTKPEQDIDENEVELMKEVLLTSIDKLENDYNSDLFVSYPSWTTRYGVEIASIDDAIHFLLYHEGLHTGTIMALKKIVSKSV